MGENFYSILGCPEDASINDIRKSYKKLALKFHPDKMIQQDGTTSQNSNFEGFSLLSQAANTLSDEKEKFKYDSSLLEKKSTKKIITDEITFNDFYENNGSYWYDCRCGGRFILSLNNKDQQNDVNDSHSIIDCDTCSLSLRVLNFSKPY